MLKYMSIMFFCLSCSKSKRKLKLFLLIYLRCICWIDSSSSTRQTILPTSNERERRGAHHILHAGFSQCISDIHLWNSSKFLLLSFLSHPPIFQACCGSSNAQSLLFFSVQLRHSLVRLFKVFCCLAFCPILQYSERVGLQTPNPFSSPNPDL